MEIGKLSSSVARMGHNDITLDRMPNHIIYVYCSIHFIYLWIEMDLKYTANDFIAASGVWRFEWNL